MIWDKLHQRYNKRVKVYTFAELAPQIQTALNAKVMQGLLGRDTGLTLIEGFVSTPIQANVGGSYQIGGPAVPMVAAVGNITNQVYYFPIKLLVPSVELQ
jgi:hypothetical protein